MARLPNYRTTLTATALERMRPRSTLTDAYNPGLRARRQREGPPVLELRWRPPGRRDRRVTVKLGVYRRHERDTPGGVPWTVMGAIRRYRELLEEGEGLLPALAPLGAALGRYDADLLRRQVVKRGEVLRLLRRELLGAMGDVELRQLTRAVLVRRIREVEASGRPGAARELRTRAGVFLGWAVDEGLLPANPLAGWRRPRATRAERLERPGRALADEELPAFWRVACEAKAPLGAYLLVRLLTRQRRSETAAMRWSDLDLDAGVWTVPVEVGKTRPLRVPLPRLVRVILRGLPRRGELVFAGRGGRPMTGWSKRLRPVYEATAAAGMAPWVPGDLRKTFRTGLSTLGVEAAVAELMVGHGPRDELARIYDRAERWPEREAAARRWALHVSRCC